jgi:hypothetical protein
MLNVAFKTKSKFLCNGFSLLVLVKAELQIPLSGGLFELKGERFPIFGLRRPSRLKRNLEGHCYIS